MITLKITVSDDENTDDFIKMSDAYMNYDEQAKDVFDRKILIGKYWPQNIDWKLCAGKKVTIDDNNYDDDA